MAEMKKMNMLAEFKEFLLQYNVLALAIAFLMGVASTALVKSLVDNIIMPPIGLILGGIDFKSFELVIKAASETTPAVAIKYGLFISELINFLIIAWVVFMVAKFILKEAKVTKK
jgi:large conductance mechanosensitive channel